MRITHHPEVLPKHLRCSCPSFFCSQCLSISKQGLLSHSRQMLPNANIGSHTSLIIYSSIHLASLPSVLPPFLPFSRCTILRSFSLSFTVHSYHAPTQMSDLTILSAAEVHWLPSSGMSSNVHSQHEVGCFKAYLPSVLMSKKSHAVIWLQLSRLLRVCLYIA